MKINRLLILGIFLVSVAVATPLAEARSQHLTLHAILLGANQNPAVQTNGHGVFIARLSKDGQSISYRLIVSNLENVTMAHIHIGNSTTNGPIVVFLFHSETPVARQHGVLATGTLTSADFIGPLKGMTMTDLLTTIMSGNAYVNVHTTQHPAGEIRGQIVLGVDD